MSSGDLPSTCKLHRTSLVKCFDVQWSNLVSGIQGRKQDIMPLSCCRWVQRSGINLLTARLWGDRSYRSMCHREVSSAKCALQNTAGEKHNFRRQKLEKTFCEKKSSHLLVMYFCLWNLWSVKVDSRNSTLFLHLLLVRRAMPRVELASRQKKKSRKMGEVTWCYIFSTAMWYSDIMNTHIYLLTINWLQSFLVCCEITFTVNIVPFLLLWTMLC